MVACMVASEIWVSYCLPFFVLLYSFYTIEYAYVCVCVVRCVVTFWHLISNDIGRIGSQTSNKLKCVLIIVNKFSYISSWILNRTTQKL